MRLLSRTKASLLQSLFVAAFLAVPALSAADNTDVAGKELRLIELFTSHGCSSCPAADRLLGKLLEQDESLVALEYHVDYWNSLVHGNAGNFVDPFSQPGFTQRQREYSAAGLAGRPGVYTPQIIVNGRVAMVGSDKRYLAKVLSRKSMSSLQIILSPLLASPDRLQVEISASEEQRRRLSGMDIVLVKYQDQGITKITGGENLNLQLVNRHIVRKVIRLGEVNLNGPITYEIASPAEGHGCVVMVQEGASSPVHAAVACP